MDLCVCLLGPGKGWCLRIDKKWWLAGLKDMGFKQKNAKSLWLSLLADAWKAAIYLELRGIRGYLKSLSERGASFEVDF